MKLLVIEDSRFLRLAMEKTLAKSGFQVTAVPNGQEGLRVAAAALPDLILLDMMLPGLDGIGVLKRLKVDPITSQIPVVILTGLSQKNELKLKEAGAAAYLEKTSLTLDTNLEALVQVINGVLGTARC